MKLNNSPNILTNYQRDLEARHAMTEWVTFTRRTEDPKLAWLERQLDAARIPHRRQGETYHAPILQVPREQLEAAQAILEPVDDIPDDDPRWSGGGG